MKKDIFLRGTLGWGVSFFIITILIRYFKQEINTAPFGSYIIYAIICLVGGTLVGYFTFKTKKEK